MSEAWFSNDTTGLENFWHPVAFAHEVVMGAPTRTELLGRRWVLLRSDAGVVAFGDECPHRRASLSGGRVVDGALECPYHGWQYDFQGKCVKVPALPAGAEPPLRAVLRAPHAVREHAGLIWMAILPPLEDLIEWPEWGAPGWDSWWLERRTTRLNGGLLTENFMDATHFAFVHRNTFGANSPSTGVEHSARQGWQLAAGFHQVTSQPGLGDVTAEVTTLLQGPFCLRMLISSRRGSRGFTFFLQPCNANETRLYLGVACDDTSGEPVRIRAETDFNNLVYDEDLRLLEDFAEPRLPLDPHREVSTPADANLLKYRRILSDISRLGDNLEDNGYERRLASIGAAPRPPTPTSAPATEGAR